MGSHSSKVKDVKDVLGSLDTDRLPDKQVRARPETQGAKRADQPSRHAAVTQHEHPTAPFHVCAYAIRNAASIPIEKGLLIKWQIRNNPRTYLADKQVDRCVGTHLSVSAPA